MGMEMMMMVDWLDLPFDLLSEIADKVSSSSLEEDHIRFGCICVQWRRSLYLEKNYEQIKLSTLPVLLIPSVVNHHRHLNYDASVHVNNYYNPKEIWLGLDHNQRYTNTRNFYSLSEKKVYDFQLQVPSNLHCRGSSHGWLKNALMELYLFIFLIPSDHPTRKKNKIQLPPLTSEDSIDSYFMKKFVFTRDPPLSSSLLLTTTNIIDDDNDFVVLGLYADWELGLGFCRPGDSAWTPLPFPYDSLFPYERYFDVICYKGQFWGILQDGTALAFDISPEPKLTLVLDPHPEDPSYPHMRYLVESAGDLFNVWREYSFPEDAPYSTVRFHVFKLDQTKMEWSKTNTLDGRMFFLGDNASISLSPSDYFPGSCKPNSIYFTDEYTEQYRLLPWGGPHDMGVFNVEDGSLEPHYISESRTIMPAPIWIQPML